MRKILVAAMALGAMQISAQELPMPSPTATLEQRVGLTDFVINYSRPGVKDRVIFGELVPYGELWRTGANASTTIEFNTPVTFAGTEVPAGKYALLTIPGEEAWTLILNQSMDISGTSGYSEDQDVLRIEVEAMEIPSVESFTIDINNLRNESADLVLLWDETMVRVPMKMEVLSVAEGNITRALEEATDEKKWQVYRNAANFYYNNDMDMDLALDYMDKSIAANDQNWYSHWLRAEILAEKKMYKEAVKSAEKAIEVGKADAKTKGTEFGYDEMIQAGMETWKNKKKES